MSGINDLQAVSHGAMYATIWVEYGITTVVMVLRAYSQVFILRKFTADDLVMVGAYVVQGIASSLVTASVHHGLGSSWNPTSLSSVQDATEMLKYAMISMPCGTIASMLGRISFILFLLKSVITVHNLRRKVLWGLIACQFVNVIPCVLQFTQCNPVSALWDPLKLIEKCQGATMVQNWGYFQGAFNGLTDLFLTGIGLAVILTLKMSRRNKIILSSIVSLSLLAMIASILKTVQLRTMNSPRFSYAMAIYAIWFLTEATVVIVTASVPRLRAIIVLGKQTKPSYNPYLTPDSGNDRAVYAKSGEYPLEHSRVSKHRSIRTTFYETEGDRSLVRPEPARSVNTRPSLDSAGGIGPVESTELRTLPQAARNRSVV
ncbi:uncharacterized protein DSM5745_10327 [Aspergillus mulundensis]|uniref:Rhodopsin domain-containing protein n=1 Tax=Aspergillus mulundensis TaxID=1810919 RepID=A0A3D8QN22_9EURO|nr:Uncharacterized protein DSM5745_10327 [Aspergillus mulundensis]RDW63216.1 Uncharacterized protein DSM5745_10327 [Aspergillus mulundensis]